MEDEWWRVPGAAVEGHRGAVRPGSGRASCSCGRPFVAQPSEHAACLALLLHLQAAVRDGARVTSGGGNGGADGGPAGVREPRAPVPSSGSGSVQLDLE